MIDASRADAKLAADIFWIVLKVDQLCSELSRGEVAFNSEDPEETRHIQHAQRGPPMHHHSSPNSLGLGFCFGGGAFVRRRTCPHLLPPPIGEPTTVSAQTVPVRQLEGLEALAVAAELRLDKHCQWQLEGPLWKHA